MFHSIKIVRKGSFGWLSAPWAEPTGMVNLSSGIPSFRDSSAQSLSTEEFLGSGVTTLAKIVDFQEPLNAPLLNGLFSSAKQPCRGAM